MAQFLEFKTFQTKLQVECHILLYCKVIKAIAPNWLSEIGQCFELNKQLILTKNHCLSLTCNAVAIDIHNASNKLTCKFFMKGKYETPTVIYKNRKISYIGRIFLNFIMITHETQLQELQYRMIHRYHPCKKWFCDLSIVDSNLCDTCTIPDTIGHYIYSWTYQSKYFGKN